MPYKDPEKRREANRRYDKSEKGRETNRRYGKSEKRREAQRRYDKSEKGREAKRRYDKSEKRLEAFKRRIWLSGRYLGRAPDLATTHAIRDHISRRKNELKQRQSARAQAQGVAPGAISSETTP